MLNFRGSLKDPLIYLGILSLFLFIFSTFGPASYFPSPGNLSPAGTSPKFIAREDLFASQEGLEKLTSPFFSLIQNNSLLSFSSPTIISPRVLGGFAGLGSDFSTNNKEIIEYTVEPGDNLSSLAEKFGISLNTLLWANDLSKNSLIKPGQKLIILPVSGVLHHVKKDETLSGIATIYKGGVAEIIAFNEISGEDIFVGDILIIPGGIMPKKSVSRIVSQPAQIPLASSYFIFPTQGKISQGLHWYNAIDIAADCGTPIYATAAGQVLKVDYGYNFGAGNYLKILHPNGIVTMYGHVQEILVSPGQTVSQGQIIALMGGRPGTPGAGKTTGCHLHFGVHGASNPFAR